MKPTEIQSIPFGEISQELNCSHRRMLRGFFALFLVIFSQAIFSPSSAQSALPPAFPSTTSGPPPTATITVLANPPNGGTVNGTNTYTVGSQVQISATAGINYGFTGWNDGNTNNPRTIIVPSVGATYTANFSVSTATIVVQPNPPNGGTVSGGGIYAVGSQVQIAALPSNPTPASGWVFSGWNDGNTDNPRTITVPAGGATHTATFSPTAVITFYHERANGALVGHAFFKLTSKYGTTAFYGFYPAGFVIAGPGYIDDDSSAPWDFGICYQISDGQYRTIAAVISHDLVFPPAYGLVQFNCMDWVASIAIVAGVQLPAFRYSNGLADPAIFGRSLASIGSGNTYFGGIVVANGATPSETLTTSITVAIPAEYSYGGIESAGHANAANLATSMGLAYDPVNLGAVNSNNISGLSVNLIGASATNALISMDWGDGFPYQEQSLALSHVYAAGTYSAHLLIVDSGAVHSYNMTVVVSSGTSSALNVTVTQFAPVNIPNINLVSAKPVPDFVVVKSASAAVFPNGHAVSNFVGIPTWTYTIQATSDITQGFQTIGTATAGADGTFQFDDAGAIGAGQRFYRATYP